MIAHSPTNDFAPILPRRTDPAKISATLKDSVLAVDVPKRPAEAQSVEIRSP